jgi:hypothetical protein
LLSPKTIHLIIKHLDCIDESLAKRMIRKRPHGETSLTSRLCDLLDEDTQAEEHLAYPLEQLNHDLSQTDELTSVSYEVETHEYTPDVEGWLTQSDLGFVLNYRDYLLPEESWSAAWLLQAKRLTPNLHHSPLYTEASRFSAVDAEQSKRINKLRKAVGLEFIKYLLYCPRPASLDRETRGKLAHLRFKNLGGRIFDYTLGLETSDDLHSDTSTLAAGVFITGVDNLPHNLAQVHNTILDTCCPLSWFFVAHFAGGTQGGDPMTIPARINIRPDQNSPDLGSLPLDNAHLAHAVVRGEPFAVELLRETLDIREGKTFRVLPPHTLKIDVSIGSDFNAETRRIQLQ